jgi:hypothetical protein
LVQLFDTYTCTSKFPATFHVSIDVFLGLTPHEVNSLPVSAERE